MSGAQDFTITKKGVLTEYRGPGGDVVIPEGVKEIGTAAFEGCTRLQSVTLPESVTKISYDAFYGCKKLQSVVIPEGVTEIEQDAFGECTRLQSVTFRDREDAVGIEVDCVFGNCCNITNVVIPKCIARIALVLFEDTPWLKSLGEFAVLDHFLIKY